MKKLIFEAHSACAAKSVCVAMAFWLHHRCFENTTHMFSRWNCC